MRRALEDALDAELRRMGLAAVGLDEADDGEGEHLLHALKVEQALREHDSGHGVGRHRVTDTGGTNIGWVTWRGELGRWEVDDDRYRLPGNRRTYPAAVELVRKRVACATREEAKRCR